MLGYLGLLSMHTKELSVKGCELPRLQFATASWDLLLHEMLPFSLVGGDHIKAGYEMAKEFAGRTRLWKPAHKADRFTGRVRRDQSEWRAAVDTEHTCCPLSNAAHSKRLGGQGREESIVLDGAAGGACVKVGPFRNSPSRQAHNVDGVHPWHRIDSVRLDDLAVHIEYLRYPAKFSVVTRRPHVS